MMANARRPSTSARYARRGNGAAGCAGRAEEEAPGGPGRPGAAPGGAYSLRSTTRGADAGRAGGLIRKLNHLGDPVLKLTKIN